MAPINPQSALPFPLPTNPHDGRGFGPCARGVGLWGTGPMHGAVREGTGTCLDDIWETVEQSVSYERPGHRSWVERKKIADRRRRFRRHCSVSYISWFSWLAKIEPKKI